MRFKINELDRYAEDDPLSAWSLFKQMGLEEECNYIEKKYLDGNNIN